jgi:hypothetical protein
VKHERALDFAQHALVAPLPITTAPSPMTAGQASVIRLTVVATTE